MKEYGKRKKWRSAAVWFVLAAVLLCCVPVFAAEGRVSDRYGLFTQEETAALEQACGSYTQETGIDAAILTVGAGEASSYEAMVRYLEDYADSYLGENSISLIVNMDIRYYYIDIKGSEALAVYTDRRQVELGEAVVRQLSAGNYAGAGNAFLSTAGQQYRYAQETNTYGTVVQEKPKGFRSGILAMSALLSALFAGILTRGRMGSHREKQLATDADRYVVPGTVNLYVNRDVFVSQYVTRVPRPDREPKVGGGGFTTGHMSGGGHMHSGHGGGF